jgi:general secretion pathway protein A
MYCEYFGFSEKPFVITPNPRFIFLGKSHREAFAHLIYGIDSHAGFIELTGEVGTGKTTVLRTLLGQLDEGRYRTALILNPCLSAEELLRAVNREYGIPWEGLSRAALVERLGEFLLEENRAGRTVVLVIDEAQNLEPKVLEQIRLISNLETERDKLIQIILSGQPELDELLARPDLRQIAQRITVRYQLTPMDREDMAAYIRHRLEVAGGVGAAEFPPKSLDLVHGFTSGYPRLVNIACDRLLLAAYGDETRHIPPRLARRTLKELRQEGKGGSLPVPRRVLLAAALVLCLLLATTLAWRQGLFSAHHVQPPTPSSPPRTSQGITSSELLVALAAVGTDKSRLQAFNAAATHVGRTPYRPAVGSTVPSLPLLARSRKFDLRTVSAPAGDLLAQPLPLILHFRLPGGEERWLALVKGDDRGFQVTPRLGKRTSLTKAELVSLQPDQAHTLRPLEKSTQGGTP